MHWSVKPSPLQKKKKEKEKEKEPILYFSKCLLYSIILLYILFTANPNPRKKKIVVVND